MRTATLSILFIPVPSSKYLVFRIVLHIWEALNQKSKITLYCYINIYLGTKWKKFKIAVLWELKLKRIIWTGEVREVSWGRWHLSIEKMDCNIFLQGCRRRDIWLLKDENKLMTLGVSVANIKKTGLRKSVLSSVGNILNMQDGQD